VIVIRKSDTETQRNEIDHLRITVYRHQISHIENKSKNDQSSWIILKVTTEN
jgi:hypothetical protein